jgi:hypothetical protein
MPLLARGVRPRACRYMAEAAHQMPLPVGNWAR